MLKRLIIISFLFFISTHLLAQMKLDKKHFYETISSNKLLLIDKELKHLEDTTLMPKQNAYRGALLMKKAGLENKPIEKLKFFKEGKELLETAIEKDQQNVEWRFLRLMIQENAPKLLGYNSNIQEDSEFIKEHFNTLSTLLQKIILDYANSSKELKFDE